MKPAPTILALLVPLLAAVVGNPPDPAFKRDLEKLAAQNDKAGMGKLVKSKPEAAIDWIVTTCEELANRPTPELETFAAMLRESWTAGIGSAFADREYENLKSLGANRRDRNELKERLDAAIKEFEGNFDAKDGMAFQNVIDELDVVAPGLEQVGDWYRASQAWIVQARCFDAPLREGSADLHRAYLAYKLAVEAREKIDLKDAVHEETAKRAAELLAQGHDKKQDPAPEPEPPSGGETGTPPGGDAGAPPAGGVPGGAPPAGAPMSGAALTVATNFEAIPLIDAYVRPNYAADDVHLLWGPLPIMAKGTSEKFTRLEGSPTVHRVGASDLRIDTDGDGQGDQKLAFTGNPVLVQIQFGKGADVRPWAFMAQIGSNRDQYQGIEVNVEPNDKEYAVYTLSAASVVGSVGGVPVRILDEDLDGVYGSKPQTWGHRGLSKDVFQPEMDSIVIGASKRARPWSEVQQIGGAWYRLAPDKVGKQIQATPMSVETGTLKLDFKGPTPPTWVVVKGSGEAYQNSYFDLVEGGAKGVEVPAGKYTLYYGEVRKGKKKLVQKTLILPGKTPPSVQVEKGKTATLTLGAPFGFDFRPQQGDGKVKIEGKSVVITGSAGERYERPWNCVAKPEAAWRRKGAKTATRSQRMLTIQDMDGLLALGWDAAFSPIDIEIDLKGEKGPVEVQLLDKKHDLFGKIESDWKE